MFGWLIGAYAKVERSTGNYNPWYPSQLPLLTHFRLALTYEKVLFLIIKRPRLTIIGDLCPVVVIWIEALRGRFARFIRT
jgi:hypothetical protein